MICGQSCARIRMRSGRQIFHRILACAFAVFMLTGLGVSSRADETPPRVMALRSAEQEMASANETIDSLAAQAGLAPLSMDVSLRPIGARSDAETSASFSDGVAVFTYTQGDTTVSYLVDVNSESVRSGRI